MLVSLKGCKFEHTKLSIPFESFNDVCAIVKEAQDAKLLSEESKQMRVDLQLNWCPSKSTTPVLKRILFQYLNTFAAKHLKKPIPHRQACFKDSWILKVYGFNTEYLQNHSTYCCEPFTECC